MLNQACFQNDSVRYNMFYDFIARNHLTIKSTDNSCIAIKNKTNALWLWVDEAKRTKSEDLLSGLANYLKAEAITSISASPSVAKSFASKHSGLTGSHYDISNSLRAYCALTRPLPPKVPGRLIQPEPSQLSLLAGFIVSIHKEIFHMELDFHTQIKNAASLVKSGALYGWQTNKGLIAMGLLTPCKEKFARLNYIYVIPSHRGRGHGKALIASLANIALQKELIPVLYTHVDNLAANRLYNSLNFADSGQIDEFTFRYYKTGFHQA